MITTNTLGYCGFAKIKKMNGTHVVEEKIFHNSGTNYLFLALAATLCGYNRTTDMPQYFDLGGTNDEGDYVAFVSNRAVLTNRLVTDYRISDTTIASVAAVFTAYIPSRTIIDTTHDVNTLALYSTSSFGDNNSTRLAEISISEDKRFKLSDSSAHSYIVEWIMTFSNVVSETVSN